MTMRSAVYAHPTVCAATAFYRDCPAELCPDAFQSQSFNITRAPVDLRVFEWVLNELPYVCQHLINTTQVSIVQHTRSCRVHRQE
jgi:hypothetical protein